MPTKRTSIDIKQCLNRCGPAELTMQWLTSSGLTRVPFCGVCAAEWWNKWGQTPTGETLVIGDTDLPTIAQGTLVPDK